MAGTKSGTRKRRKRGSSPGGPLEPLLVICFAIALVALVVWFFFFAENPLLR